MLNIELIFSSEYCNGWPTIRVSLNDVDYHDGVIISQQRVIIRAAELENNKLRITHYGKAFGENGVWDTHIDINGDTIADKAVIKDVIVNEVSIQKYLQSIPYVTEDGNTIHDTRMGFNGTWELLFASPVYDWIITSFLAKPADTSKFVTETSHNMVFNYDLDMKEIAEIEEHLKRYETLVGKSSSI